MVDKVRPLKIERPSAGGSDDDMLPTEAKPLQDYISGKGFAFEENDTTLLDLDVLGNIQFQDANQASSFRLNRLVKDFGTPASSLVASVQNTSNSAKVLTGTSNTVQIFEGTIAGQIVRLPNATTILVGHLFEVWNFSSQTIQIQDAGSNVLATINSNGRTQILLRSNSSSNGSWGLTYTLDNGNVFGTQAYYAEALPETSTTSTTTFLNKVSLNTPALPLGDYLVQWQFIWRAANANRSLDVRIQRGAANIINWQPFTANIADRQLISGFRRVTGISGVQTFTLDFKVSGTGTIVFMQQAALNVWRIA